MIRQKFTFVLLTNGSETINHKIKGDTDKICKICKDFMQQWFASSDLFKAMLNIHWGTAVRILTSHKVHTSE